MEQTQEDSNQYSNVLQGDWVYPANRRYRLVACIPAAYF